MFIERDFQPEARKLDSTQSDILVLRKTAAKIANDHFAAGKKRIPFFAKVKKSVWVFSNKYGKECIRFLKRE